MNPRIRRRVRLVKFQEALGSLPIPGSGQFHRRLLGVANLGAWAQLPGNVILERIREAIPAGGRRVPDQEIRSAVVKAVSEIQHVAHCDIPYHPNGHPKPDPQKLQSILEVGRERLASNGGVLRSQIPLARNPCGDAVLALNSLYAPDDLLFAGPRLAPGRLGENIRTAEEWARRIRQGRWPGPHFLLNPLTGEPAGRGNNPDSLRSDACVRRFKYALVEFDVMSMADQLAFFAGTDLPFMAVVWSGGKSLHGWLPVQCADEAEWRKRVGIDLFDGMLIPLGADGACRNPSRLSRMPGFIRPDTGKPQQLLSLNPVREGGAP